MYPKCGSMEDAQFVFDELPHCDVVPGHAIGICSEGRGWDGFGTICTGSYSCFDIACHRQARVVLSLLLSTAPPPSSPRILAGREPGPVSPCSTSLSFAGRGLDPHNKEGCCSSLMLLG